VMEIHTQVESWEKKGGLLRPGGESGRLPSLATRGER
jgi:hypothetical protein